MKNPFYSYRFYSDRTIIYEKRRVINRKYHEKSVPLGTLFVMRLYCAL